MLKNVKYYEGLIPFLTITDHLLDTMTHFIQSEGISKHFCAIWRRPSYLLIFPQL